MIKIAAMISDFSISDDEFLQIVDENENYETEIFLKTIIKRRKIGIIV